MDGRLVPNTTYTYRVSAVYAVGTSLPSNTASARTTSISKLTINSQAMSGDKLTGYYCELRDSSSSIIGTGFTPCSFSLVTGSDYTVAMGSYGSNLFDHWLDTGLKDNPRHVSISSDTHLTAVYAEANS